MDMCHIREDEERGILRRDVMHVGLAVNPLIRISSHEFAESGATVRMGFSF